MRLGCDVFDFEPDTDVDLTDFASLEPTIAGPENCVPVTVTVFVEGLTASTTLGDAPIDVLADPDSDMTFTLQSTELVTVASLTITPSSGPAGTPLSITLQPAIAPLTFDAATTLDWDGVFQPMVGAPTGSFQVAYNASQFRESSSSQAVVIVGDGTTTNAPDFENAEGPGTTPGVFTFNLASVTLTKSFDFAPGLDAGTFEEVDYPDGPGGATPPTIGGEWTELPIVALSITPNPTNPSEDLLLVLSGSHVAVVARIDENATSVASAPAMLEVDLVSYDGSGVEVDRLENVALNQVSPDGDPNSIVYHNDLSIPLLLVDTALTKANYSNVLLLECPDGGSAVIVPATT